MKAGQLRPRGGYRSFALFLIMLVLSAGCEKAAYYGPPPPEPPAVQPLNEPLFVVSVTPADGAEDVSCDACIEVRFSRPPDPATVTGASFVLVDEITDAVVPGSVEPAAGDPAEPATAYRLTPAEPLAVPHHPYRIELTETIAAPDGTALDLELSLVSTPCRFVTEGEPDTEPPWFFYYDVHAEAIGPTAVRLRWFPALDNPGGTPSYRLTYAIYLGTAPDAIDFTQPAAVTQPMETSQTVGGLNPNTTYYFVVHPVDESGNEDDNTIVVSAHTWLPADTTELTILYSADVFGSLEPCG